MPPALAATVGGLSLAALLVGAIQIARPESGHVSDACSIELHARETCAAAPPESQQVTTDEGVVEYRRGTMLHRIDGPAPGRTADRSGTRTVVCTGWTDRQWCSPTACSGGTSTAACTAQTDPPSTKSGRSWYYLNGRMVSESVLGL